ncbi:MAG: hypothetical protein HC880_22000 [Bacteroidia bacterium]|nr:hypothetical protein [Bacteroidia bacterium]
MVSTQLDANGQTVSASDGGGPLPLVERSEDNLVTERIEGRGNKTEYEYDERGNVTLIRDTVTVRDNTPSDIFPGDVFQGRIYPVNSGSEKIVTADINNDGNADLLIKMKLSLRF